MRKLLLLPLVLWACGGAKEAPPAEAAAALTAADVTGTYVGSTMAEGTDSVLTTWTVRVTANAAGGLDGKIVNDATPNDTVAFVMTVSGDSALGVSVPYTDPMAPAGSPQMAWTSVARPGAGNAWSGSLAIMIAGTDSVVQRAHWAGTRTP